MAGRAEDLTTGDEVEGYRVEDLIGWGSSSRVYRVRKIEDESIWALKVLAGGGTSKERFRLEGAVQGVLEHPNLVRVVKVARLGDSPALVMEYIEGPSLKGWLEGHLPTPELALELMYGIASGVGHIHSAGLIHRDVKPANVMLEPMAGGVLVPRVTDFGLAKLEGAVFSGSTLVGTSMGTPEYAAPEQGMDASTVDLRADIYSLGCLFYELMCGRGPFEGLDAYRLPIAKRDQTFPRPASLVFEIAPDLEGLILEMMAPDVDDRISSLDEVLARLAVLRGFPERTSTSLLTGLLGIPLLVLLVAMLVVTQCGGPP